MGQLTPQLLQALLNSSDAALLHQHGQVTIGLQALLNDFELVKGRCLEGCMFTLGDVRERLCALLSAVAGVRRRVAEAKRQQQQCTTPQGEQQEEEEQQEQQERQRQWLARQLEQEQLPGGKKAGQREAGAQHGEKHDEQNPEQQEESNAARCPSARQGEMESCERLAMLADMAVHLQKRIKELMCRALPPLTQEDEEALAEEGMPRLNATLVLVPDNSMVQHWEQQISLFCKEREYLGRLMFISHSTEDVFPAGMVQNERNALANNGGVVVVSVSMVRSLLARDHPLHDILFGHRWRRLVLDEGHIMGRGINFRNAGIAAINADIVWCMTGTPTPQIAQQSGLSHLERMLRFLRLGYLADADSWRRNVVDAFGKARSVEACGRLIHLLSRLMILHSKTALRNLPHPVRRTTLLPPSHLERVSYNTMAAAVRSNIVLTSMEGKTSGKQDSILRQPAQARRFLTNLRLTCCGGLYFTTGVTAKLLAEMDAMLADCGLDAARREAIRSVKAKTRAS